MAALAAALEARPDDLGVRVHLVDRLLTLGDARAAVEHVDALMEFGPTDASALDAAVRACEAAGDPRAAALDAARRALDGAIPPRGAEPVEGDEAEWSVPDTADELLGEFESSAAPEELPFGELGLAGVNLDDVGGLDDVKQQIDRAFLAPLRNPEMARTFGKSAGGGLLLWGPPGCGKTFLARAIAGEMAANFYDVGIADVLDMWIGSSERNLASVFEAARRNAPCVLFFDEIDALGQKRSQLRFANGLRRVVNQLLAEMDGLSQDNDGLFVLGATNHPWDVDEALLRPGRFDRRVLVLPPDDAARAAILRYHLRGRPTGGIDIGPLVERTEGYSGADLSFVVETAVEACLDASMRSGDVQPVETHHLMEALDQVGSTSGPWLETARNHVMYSNSSGEYDELEAYLKAQQGKRRRRG